MFNEMIAAGGGGGGSFINPIWENPYPATSYDGPKTESIDLSNCDKVLIIQDYSAGAGQCVYAYCDVGSSVTITSGGRFSRTYTVTASDVSITRQSSTAHGEAYAIPMIIVGLKTV